MKDHIIGVDKMIQSLDKSFRRLFVSDPKRFTFDSCFPPSSIPFNYLQTFEFAAQFFGKRDEILHFFVTTFNLGQKS